MKPKVVGSTMAGGGVAAVIAWAWNGAFPEYPMTVEVAAVVGTTIVGPAVAWAVSWLPKPHDKQEA